jgi:hypothetical protein
LVLALAFGVGCGGKKSEEKKAPDESAESDEAMEGEPECEVDSDCSPTYVCLGGECTSTSHGSFYSNPRRAVSPGKVKREVEKRLQNSQDRRDDRLKQLGE